MWQRSLVYPVLLVLSVLPALPALTHVLGSHSQVAGFCRSVERHFKKHGAELSNCDGAVAVVHTEGGVDAQLAVPLGR